MEQDTVYRVICSRTFGDAFGAHWIDEFFSRDEAEAARERYNAQYGVYARPVEERPYTPVEHKSNFFGPPVRWDLPSVYCGRMLSFGEALERRYGEK